VTFRIRRKKDPRHGAGAKAAHWGVCASRFFPRALPGFYLRGSQLRTLAFGGVKDRSFSSVPGSRSRIKVKHARGAPLSVGGSAQGHPRSPTITEEGSTLCDEAARTTRAGTSGEYRPGRLPALVRSQVHCPWPWGPDNPMTYRSVGPLLQAPEDAQTLPAPGEVPVDARSMTSVK
jgi:hypothetical protein